MTADRAGLVSRADLDEFVAWYRTRVRFPRYAGVDEHWKNALQTLAPDELENGRAQVARLRRPKYVPPVEFWHVCKGTKPPKTNQRFRKKIDSQTDTEGQKETKP